MYRSFKEIQLNKFFAGVSESVIDAHFKPECFLDVNEGDILYQLGDNADTIYLLLRGNVKIKFPSHNRISSKIFNDFFGEKELMDGSPRISSAMADSKCLIYKIDAKTFNSLLSETDLIRNNIDTYGDLNIPGAESASKNGTEITDKSDQISSEIPNPADEEQPEIISEKLDCNIDSFSDSLSDIIDGDFFDVEPQIEADKENITEDSGAENSNRPDNIHESQENNIEKTVLEDTELTEEELYAEQNYVQKILNVLIAWHSKLKVYETVQSIINETKILTESEAGEIYLVEENAANIIRYSDKETIKKYPFYKISESLTASCILHKSIIKTDNPPGDNKFVSEIDMPVDSELNHIIYIPLLNTTKEIVAVLQLARSSKNFTEDEINDIELISDHAALAIEKSKHIQQMIGGQDKNVSIHISKFLSENISTPVDVINRYTMLLNNEELSEKVKEIISMLQKQANFFPDIIRTAFDYNKSDFKLNLKILSLNTYFNSISELLSEYCDSRNINLFKKIGEDARVKIDPGKLYMAIYQAIKNGCDAMGINGNLYISTAREDTSANIIIRDEGTGIRDEDKGDMFKTVFSERKGRNKLGLAITKKIIDLHQGKVSLSSKLNEGTTLTFSIPVSKDTGELPKLNNLALDEPDADDFNLDLDDDTNLDLKTE